MPVPEVTDVEKDEIRTYHKSTFDNIPEEKRSRILSVATQEFAEHGYENANVNVIASKAGISVGSVYKYFDTKTDLYLTCVSNGVSFLERKMQDIIITDEDVMIKLEKLVRAAIEFSKENPALIKLYNVFTTDMSDPAVSALARGIEFSTAETYKKAIIEGQQNGDIRRDIDPDVVAFLLDNMLLNFQFSYACDYYKERFCIFAGDDILDRDDYVIESFLKYVKSALMPQK